MKYEFIQVVLYSILKPNKNGQLTILALKGMSCGHLKLECPKTLYKYIYIYIYIYKTDKSR